MILEPDNRARNNIWDEKTDEILVHSLVTRDYELLH